MDRSSGYQCREWCLDPMSHREIYHLNGASGEASYPPQVLLCYCRRSRHTENQSAPPCQQRFHLSQPMSAKGTAPLDFARQRQQLRHKKWRQQLPYRQLRRC